MRAITKSLVTRGRDRRIEFEMKGIPWGQAPVRPSGPPPRFAAVHYALEEVHRAWKRHADLRSAQLCDLWRAAWLRASGDSDAPEEGVAFLESYLDTDPFGLAGSLRRIVGVEVELVVAQMYGYSWSARPDVICVSKEGYVEAIELTQSSTPRRVELVAALDHIGLEACLPPRLRELPARVRFAHLPTPWVLNGCHERDVSLRPPNRTLAWHLPAGRA